MLVEINFIAENMGTGNRQDSKSTMEIGWVVGCGRVNVEKGGD